MNFHSKKILIIIIACNIVAMVGYYFLFQYIKKQTTAASSLSSTIDLGQQKNSHINSLRSLVKDTESQRQHLATFLLSSDNEISFIEQIENLAKNSGLAVRTNNVSSLAGGAETTRVFQMQTQTVGSWSNTLYFLSQVENLPYGIKILGVSLNRQSADGSTGGSSWVTTFDVNVVES
jgi:Tfp pilus assembly protein PilO